MNTQYTFFWQNRSPFSNWYPSVFEHSGITFTRGEQYMMYRKAITFGDTSTARIILATDNPMEHKDLGRQVSNYDDAVWAAIRFDIMVEGLYAKFDQNPKLKAALLTTVGTELVEASPYDLIWGIGFKEDHPSAQNKSEWRGQNLLGKVLDKVRDKIING